MDVDDIGVNENALLCHTDKRDCCGEPPNRDGEWYFPNGTKVGIQGISQDEFYRNRGTQVVRLNHQQGISQTERGLFRCEVPDSKNVTQTVYVNIGIHFLISMYLYPIAKFCVIIQQSAWNQQCTSTILLILSHKIPMQWLLFPQQELGGIKV